MAVRYRVTEKPPTRIQQKNRAAITAAALEVFSRYGLRGATLDQIAEEAGLSKPNLLYYYKSKDAIYTVILEGLLETWLDPLHALNDSGDPIEELLAYTMRKLDMSRDYPRESRLFANEILQGAPHIAPYLSGELRKLVDEKSRVIEEWIAAGKIKPVQPKHLFFSIWAVTQHYADFEVQVRAVLNIEDPMDGARQHLTNMIRRMLTP